MEEKEEKLSSKPMGLANQSSAHCIVYNRPGPDPICIQEVKGYELGIY